MKIFQYQVKAFYDVHKSVLFFHKNGSCIPKNLSLKYGIDKKCISIFPYCYNYKQACEEGNIEAFLKKNLNCSTRNPNFYFMSNLQKIAKMLKERM